jgi:hypothetical protein
MEGLCKCTHAPLVFWNRLPIRSHETSTHAHTPPISNPLSRNTRILIKPLIYSTHLFPQRHEQPISNIPQTRLNHSLIIHILITPPNPNLHPLFPLLTRLPQALPRRQYTDHNNPLNPPIPQTINRRTRRRAGRNHRVAYNCQFGQIVVCGRGGVVRQVVVVFDGLESGFLAVEAEVVDWDGHGEQGG